MVRGQKIVSTCTEMQCVKPRWVDQIIKERLELNEQLIATLLSSFGIRKSNLTQIWKSEIHSEQIHISSVGVR